jgi:hypothetical protein
MIACPLWSSAWPNSVRSDSRHATVSKSFIFDEFAPLAVGTSWPSNARGWPIPAAIPLIVRYVFFSIVDDALALD